MTNIGERLRELRDSKGVNQETAAEACNMTRVALARYETGTRRPKTEYAEKLADYYGVTVDYLLCRDDTPVSSGEMVSYDFGDGETKMSPADKRAEGKNLLQIATDEEYDEFVNYMRYTLSKRKDGGQK